MTGEQGIVRGVSWRDLCPWLVIFRAFRLAVSPSLLALATIGVLVNPLGWRVAEAVFIGEAVREDPGFREFLGRQRQWPRSERAATPGTEHWLRSVDVAIRRPLDGGVGRIASQLSAPYRLLFSGASFHASQYLYLAAGTLWSLLVWGFIGGVLTRVAVMQFGRDERIDIVQASSLALRRLQALVLAPLFPIGAIALLVIPCMVLGWLMRLDFGVLVAGVLWILVVVVGLLIALLVIGLALGWPLMPVAIVAEEGGDQFEAFHRSYSYVFGRPLHYLFYVGLALAIGALGCVAVDAIAGLAIQMSGWAVSWGTGEQRWFAVASIVAGDEASGTLWAGGRLIGFVDHLTSIVTTGFRYSFFFCAAAAVYLLLRQQVDEAEFDELYQDEYAFASSADALDKQLGINPDDPPTGPNDDIG